VRYSRRLETYCTTPSGIRYHSGRRFAARRSNFGNGSFVARKSSPPQRSRSQRFATAARREFPLPCAVFSRRADGGRAGTPGTRLARAGYTSYQWGENIGCSSGGPSAIAVATELFFQSEKSYNGGHWANLKNAAFSQVGVGVWDVGGYTLVVFDFYHP